MKSIIGQTSFVQNPTNKNNAIKLSNPRWIRLHRHISNYCNWKSKYELVSQAIAPYNSEQDDPIELTLEEWFFKKIELDIAVVSDTEVISGCESMGSFVTEKDHGDYFIYIDNYRSHVLVGVPIMPKEHCFIDPSLPCENDLLEENIHWELTKVCPCSTRSFLTTATDNLEGALDLYDSPPRPDGCFEVEYNTQPSQFIPNSQVQDGCFEVNYSISKQGCSVVSGVPADIDFSERTTWKSPPLAEFEVVYTPHFLPPPRIQISSTPIVSNVTPTFIRPVGYNPLWYKLLLYQPSHLPVSSEQNELLEEGEPLDLSDPISINNDPPVNNLPPGDPPVPGNPPVPPPVPVLVPPPVPPPQPQVPLSNYAQLKVGLDLMDRQGFKCECDTIPYCYWRKRTLWAWLAFYTTGLWSLHRFNICRFNSMLEGFASPTHLENPMEFFKIYLHTVGWLTGLLLLGKFSYQAVHKFLNFDPLIKCPKCTISESIVQPNVHVELFGYLNLISLTQDKTQLLLKDLKNKADLWMLKNAPGFSSNEKALVINATVREIMRFAACESVFYDTIGRNDWAFKLLNDRKSTLPAH